MHTSSRLRSLFTVLILVTATSLGQPQFQKFIGGPGNDEAYAVLATPDGGWVITGQTTSAGAGAEDAFLMKLSPTYAIEWTRVYGGPGSDWVNRLLLTPDSSIVAAGFTSVPGNDWDAWLFKVSLTGDLRWSKRYGGPGNDLLADVVPHPFGGYWIAGHGSSFGGSGYDLWLIRVNEMGEVLSTRTFGGFTTEALNQVLPTADGGAVLAGHTYSFGAGMHDLLLIKVSGSGDLDWAKTYGTSGDETAYVIRQRSDGGYIVVGNTHGGGFGSIDCMILRVDTGGAVVSASTIGTTGEDQLVRACNLDADHLALAGWAAGPSGLLDGWFATLSYDGVLSHSKQYGGPSYERFVGISRSGPDHVLMAGAMQSPETNGKDIFLVKTDISGPPLAGSFAGPSNVSPMFLSTSSPALSVSSPTITASFGPDSSVFADFTVSNVFGADPPHLRIPKVFSRAGDPVSIPVMLSSPFGVAGADVAVKIDTSVIEVHGIRRGTLTGAFALAFNLSYQDSILVSLANASGMSQIGEGSIFVMDGVIRAGVPDSLTSPVRFVRADLYDESAQPIELTTEDGSIGTGFGQKGDVNVDQLVNASDAIIVLRIAANLEQRNERDLWSADFDGNGVVTPYDAVGVLRASVGLSTPPPGDTMLTLVRILIPPVTASAGQLVNVPIRIMGLPELVSGTLEFGFDGDRVEVRGLQALPAFNGLVQHSTSAASNVKVVFASSTAWDRSDDDIAVLELKARSSLTGYQPAFIGGGLTDQNGRWVNTFQFVTTGVEEGSTVRSFALHPNHPNPFNPSTTIGFDVPRRSRVQIVVRNLLGQIVAELVNDVRPAGAFQVSWNAQAGSGVYFCTMRAIDEATGEVLGNFTRKMILVK